MTPEEFVRWLKEENLFGLVNVSYPCFKNILQDCLEIGRRELLIIGDLGSAEHRIAPIMTGCYLLAAKRLNLLHKLIVLEQDPYQPTEIQHIVRNLPENSALSLAFSGRLTFLGFERGFRAFAKQHHHRFSSTTGLANLPTEKWIPFLRSIDIDYTRMIALGRQIKEVLDFGSEISVITDKGTDLRINIQGQTSLPNTGHYSEYSGNLPAGEVYIAPRGIRVEGVVVIDGSAKIGGDTLLVKTPIRITVEKGEITSITGGNEASLLKQRLAKAQEKTDNKTSVMRIGEFGIGINPGASFLGPTIINEKTLGTAHVAIGSNDWFGGTIYAPVHYDLVFKNPTLFVDGKPLDIRSYR